MMIMISRNFYNFHFEYQWENEYALYSQKKFQICNCQLVLSPFVGADYGDSSPSDAQLASLQSL